MSDEQNSVDIERVYTLYRNIREKEEGLKLTKSLIENQIKSYAKHNGITGQCYNFETGHNLQVRYRKVKPQSKNFDKNTDLYEKLSQLEEMLKHEQLKAEEKNSDEIEETEDKIAELEAKVKWLKNTDEGRKIEEEISEYEVYEPSVVLSSPKEPECANKMNNLLKTKQRLNKLLERNDVSEIDPDDIPF